MLKAEDPTISAAAGGSNATREYRDDSSLWKVAVVIGVMFCAAYLVVPLERTGLRTALNATGDLLALVAIVVGVNRYRPRVPAAWLMFAAGFAMWMIADVIWGFYQIAGAHPYPSAADPFYLLGYPFFAGGLWRATHAQAVGFDWRAVIDPAIVVVGAAFAAWVFLVWPAISDPSVHGLAKLISVIYPVGDLLLVAVAVRFMLGAQWRSPSLRLLVTGLTLILLGDVWYALAPAGDLYELRLADTILLAGALSVGLAGLHCSMPALTEHRPDVVSDRAGDRVALAVGTGLIVPVVLLIQAWRNEPLHVAAALITTMALATLLVARSSLSATWARRAAGREKLLRRYSAELLAAAETDDLYTIARETTVKLAGDGSVAIVRDGAPPTTARHSLTLPVDAGGERAALIVVSGNRFDIEDRREAFASVAAQLSLALERQRLLAREQEAARALNEQNERLRELDRMKDQFVSSVSHELRSPMTSIVGYVELLLDDEAGEMNDDQRHFLGIVDRNCARLTKLVDDILFVARVDAGRLSLDMQSLDIAELAAASAESAQPVAERKDIALRLDAEPGIAPLWADPTRITQLLDNLISNAVKFTPQGGTVTVGVAQRDDSCRLEVRDTGVGIPKDEVDRLFVRFFRASTSKVAAGTGLGLSITKSIVEAHRGTIAVESELGIGTTFVVDLPLQAPRHAAPTGEEQSRERLRTQ